MEYEPPRSSSPTPAVSPHRTASATQLGHHNGSSGDLSAKSASAATVASSVHSSAPVLTPSPAPAPAPAPAAAVSAVSTPALVTPTAAAQQTYTAHVAAPVAAPQPQPAHVSVNLLDMDDDLPAPAPATAAAGTPQPARTISLLECAGRFTPVLFQQMWGRLQEAFAGQVCTLGRRPGATSELEAALRTQKVSSLLSFNYYSFFVYNSLLVYLCVLFLFLRL